MARVWVNPHVDGRGNRVRGHWRQVKGHRGHKPLPAKTGLGKGRVATIVRSNRAQARAGSRSHMATLARTRRLQGNKRALRVNQRRARKLRTKR